MKKALPHVIAILSFALISIAFYSPALSGKKLKMGDLTQWKGMAKELRDYKATTGEEAIWTNSMFSGMPGYQISVSDTGNLIKHLDKVYRLWLPRPIDVLFKAMLGFYILLMCMRVNPVVGAIGAISFGLSSFFILYLGAGHATKMNAVGYIAPILGGLLFAFRRHALKGALIVSLFLALHIGSNHLQMTYYALILIVFVGLGELIRKIVLKDTNSLPKTIGFLIVGAIIGSIPNYNLLSTTAEYGNYSTRGSSDLTLKAETEGLITTTDDGLGREYILQYNMAYGEWFSVYAPNVKGGRTALLAGNPEAKKVMNKQAREFSSQYQIYSYWGEQLGTAGAFYFGAFMFFLAICAIFLLKDTIKWSLLFVGIVSIIASWKLGSTPDFFIDNLPLWNKFRDTKMMLILLMIIVPLLGSLFLNQFISSEEFRTNAKKKLFLIGGGFALFNIILLTAPSSLFDFLSSSEVKAFEQLKGEAQGKKIISEIIKGREAIFNADLMRSFIIFILGFGVLIFSSMRKDLAKYCAYALGLIFLVDMWSVDHRYFDSSSAFETNKQYNTPFPAENADKQILGREKSTIPDFESKVALATKIYQENSGDKRNNDSKKLQREFEVLNQNTNYRVLNLGNPWSEARTAYYHKCIGGYHGAKLKNYQELIDFHLGEEVKTLLNQLQTSGNPNGEFPMLKMLNTKYLIGNLEGEVIPFSGSYGNAWFVKNIQKVPNADAEMTTLGTIVPENTAVIQEKFAQGLDHTYSTDGSITLSEYQPNQLTYDVNSSEKGFAVFSEIYYPAGWNAYIDGSQVDHQKVNYLLRGLEIPAGAKEVVFKFEPQTYYTSRAISKAGSIILILLCLGMFFYTNRGFFNQLREEKNQ